MSAAGGWFVAGGNAGSSAGGPSSALNAATTLSLSGFGACPAAGVLAGRVSGTIANADTNQTFWQRVQRTERPFAPIAIGSIW
jgi:hypothetical protein